MVGVRQFDTEDALDRAMGTFWELGYEATSMDDLTKATGLSRSSLYSAFGNKEGLFLRVIDHYLSCSRSMFFDALGNGTIEEALRGALNVFKDRLTAASAQPGCLLVLATESSESRTPGIRRRVTQAFAEEEDAFYQRLRKAQTEGEISPKSDVRSLARFFAAQSRAMAVNARVNPDQGALSDIIDVALQCLEGHLVQNGNGVAKDG